MTADTGRKGVIPEEVILETCGERRLPEMGVVEQVWKTDPIPPGEIEERAAACTSICARRAPTRMRPFP